MLSMCISNFNGKPTMAKNYGGCKSCESYSQRKPYPLQERSFTLFHKTSQDFHHLNDRFKHCLIHKVDVGRFPIDAGLVSSQKLIGQLIKIWRPETTG